MINADKNFLYEDLTNKIIAGVYKVFNTLGAGFLEKVYENALAIELNQQGLKVEQQQPLQVCYEDIVVGVYFADLLVEDKVIVALKAVSELIKIHELQLVNYLKATGMKVGLLINFGETISIKRKVMQTEAERKNSR